MVWVVARRHLHKTLSKPVCDLLRHQMHQCMHCMLESQKGVLVDHEYPLERYNLFPQHVVCGAWAMVPNVQLQGL